MNIKFDCMFVDRSRLWCDEEDRLLVEEGCARKCKNYYPRQQYQKDQQEFLDFLGSVGGNSPGRDPERIEAWIARYRRSQE